MKVFKSLLIKSELYEQNGSQRVGIREFVKRGILKGKFFMDVGIGTDDYWGVIDAVFVENLEPEAEPRIMKSKW